MFVALALSCLCSPSPQGPIAAPAPPPSAPSSPTTRLGGLRQVQLLEVTEGDAPRVRFATSHQTPGVQGPVMEIAVYDQPLRIEPAGRRVEGSTLGDPVAAMEVALPSSTFPQQSWQERRNWFFVELDSLQYVVVEDARRVRVLVLRFPSGETLAELEAVPEIFDVRARPRGIELLFRTSNRIEYARIDPADGVSGRRPIVVKLGGPSAAAFIVAEPNAPLRDEVVALVSTDDSQRLEHISLTSGVLAAIELDLDGTRQSAPLLRVAGRAQHDRIWVLATNAGYDGVSGVAVSASRRANEPFGALLWRNTEDPQLAQRVAVGDGTQRWGHFGQAIALLPDQDGDGVPEAVISTPSAMFGGRVELLPLDRDGGATLGGFPARLGSSLSANAQGRYVLAGGAGHVNYPDHPAQAGSAMLLRVTDRGAALQVVGSWRTNLPQ